jgi:hypothetical protein
VVGSFVEAAPEDVGMSSAGLANVSRLVRDYVDEERFPGATCGSAGCWRTAGTSTARGSSARAR